MVPFVASAVSKFAFHQRDALQVFFRQSALNESAVCFDEPNHIICLRCTERTVSMYTLHCLRCIAVGCDGEPELSTVGHSLDVVSFGRNRLFEAVR